MATIVYNVYWFGNLWDYQQYGEEEENFFFLLSSAVDVTLNVNWMSVSRLLAFTVRECVNPIRGQEMM